MSERESTSAKHKTARSVHGLLLMATNATFPLFTNLIYQSTTSFMIYYTYAVGLDYKTWEFNGEGCISQFVTTFTHQKFKNYMFLVHNSKGYDSYFIVKQLLVEKMVIRLIVQEGKLLCITVRKLGVRVIDSLCFLPMKLAKLPKAMGFEGCKGFFQHFLSPLRTGAMFAHFLKKIFIVTNP